MKFIIKGTEPKLFSDWKNEANEEWTPSYDKLRGATKDAVYEALRNEQGFICCYCEKELLTNDYHIEHLNPQEAEIVDPLDFSNMMCSCQKNLSKGEPLSCGNSKGSWFNKKLFVSPLNKNCEEKFKFTSDGQIQPRNSKDLAAISTINKLRLDIDKLNSMRNSAISPFIDESLSSKDLKDFVDGYLANKDDNNGKFNEFYTTIKYLFKSQTETL